MRSYLKGEQRIIEERRKASKFSRLKMFVRRNKWQIYATGMLIVCLIFVSSLPDVAYAVSIKVDSIQIYVEGHPCYGFVVSGDMEIASNPLVYPLSHLTGNGRISGAFARWSGSTYPQPQTTHYATTTVKEGLILQAVLTEIPRNLAYTGLMSVIMAFGIRKLFKKIWVRPKKSKPA